MRGISRFICWCSKLRIAFAAVVGLVLMSVDATAQPLSFVGEWQNKDYRRQNIDRIEIAQSGVDFTLHVFGNCQPADCDWGTVPAHRYSDSIAGNSSPMAGALTGNYRLGLLTKEVVVQFVGGRLQYEVFTHFGDNSGRQDYISTGYLSRYRPRFRGSPW